MTALPETPAAIPSAIPSRVHRLRWWTLAVLCLSLLMVVVDNTIVNVALPTLSIELDASTTELQWIVDAYTLVFAALLLAFGHFGDRFGRKLALQLGLVVFAATSLLAALSTTSAQLIGARALMGIGAAFVFPATLAILVSVFTDRRERAAAIGIWSACTGLAVALGPVTGGYLLEHFEWGAIFLVNLPLAAIAIIAGWFLVPTSRDPNAGRMDHLGLVLSAAGVGLVVWSIIEAPHLGWTAPAVMVGGMVGVGLLAGFVAWERRIVHPLLDVRLFRNARFSAASISVAAAFFALFGFIFLITQYLQLVQGYSPLEAGIRTLPFAIATGRKRISSTVGWRRPSRAATARPESPAAAAVHFTKLSKASTFGLLTWPGSGPASAPGSSGRRSSRLPPPHARWRPASRPRSGCGSHRRKRRAA